MTSSNALVARLVEHVLLWGRDAAGRETVRAWLRSLGCEVTLQEDGTTRIVGTCNKMVCALTDNLDPNTVAVQLGFATAGMFWPRAYPGLQAAVNKVWREQVRAEKAARSAASA